jgi:hypothetical protein
MAFIDYKKTSVRSAAILTNSYVAGTVIGPTTGDKLLTHQYNQLTLLVDFTIGSLTDVLIKVEFSDDGTTYFQEHNKTVSSGITTFNANEYKLTATGKVAIGIPVNYRFIKISAVGTGTVTSSSLAIDAILSVV